MSQASLLEALQTSDLSTGQTSDLSAPTEAYRTPDQLLQVNKDQLDPNYNRNAQAAALIGELNKQPSKLEQKQQQVQSKLEKKTENNEGQDGLARLLGSSAITTVTSLADTVLELGATGVGAAADATGLRDYYTKQEEQYSKELLDPYQQEFADSVTGYDRTNYAATQEEVLQGFKDGNYIQATAKALTLAPEVLTESIPFIATLGVGGRLKAVKEAMTIAKSTAAAQGLSRAAIKASVATAEKEAAASLSLASKLGNKALKNTGLLAMSMDMTKQQSEEFAKNNNGVGMSGLEMVRATAVNTVLNALERFTFKSAAGFKETAKAIKPVWGELSKEGRTRVRDAVFAMAGGMSKEAGQEYLQTWGEIFNENFGTANGKVLTADNQAKALTGGALGLGAGGLTGTPSSVGKLANALGQKRKGKKAQEALLSYSENGHATRADRAAHLKKTASDYKTIKSDFKELEQQEADIDTINKSDRNPLAKLFSIQASLSKKYNADEVGTEAVREFGSSFVTNMVKELYKQPSIDKGTLDPIEKMVSEGNLGQAVQATIQWSQDNAANLSPEIQTKLNSEISTLNNQAQSLLDKGTTNITYNQSLHTLNKHGVDTDTVKKNILNKEKPSSVKDINVEDLANLDAKEIKEKLSGYDNKTVAKFIKEAAAIRKQERRDRANIRRDPNTSKARVLRNTVKNLTSSTPAEKVQKEANKLIKSRRLAKKKYNPKASLKERFEALTDRGKKYLDNIDTDPKKQSSTDKANIQSIKKTIVQSISSKTPMTDEHKKTLQEYADKLESMGQLTKSLASKIRSKLQTTLNPQAQKHADTEKDLKVLYNRSKKAKGTNEVHEIQAEVDKILQPYIDAALKDHTIVKDYDALLAAVELMLALPTTDQKMKDALDKLLRDVQDQSVFDKSSPAVQKKLLAGREIKRIKKILSDISSANEYDAVKDTLYKIALQEAYLEEQKAYLLKGKENDRADAAQKVYDAKAAAIAAKIKKLRKEYKVDVAEAKIVSEGKKLSELKKKFLENNSNNPNQLVQAYLMLSIYGHEIAVAKARRDLIIQTDPKRTKEADDSYKADKESINKNILAEKKNIETIKKDMTTKEIAKAYAESFLSIDPSKLDISDEVAAAMAKIESESIELDSTESKVKKKLFNMLSVLGSKMKEDDKVAVVEMADRLVRSGKLGLYTAIEVADGLADVDPKTKKKLRNKLVPLIRSYKLQTSKIKKLIASAKDSKERGEFIDKTLNATTDDIINATTGAAASVVATTVEAAKKVKSVPIEKLPGAAKDFISGLMESVDIDSIEETLELMKLKITNLDYDSMKDTLIDLANVNKMKKKIVSVSEILDSNGNKIIDLGDC